MQFAELVGQQILLNIPRLDQTHYQKVKLIGVETGGLWLESQALTNCVLQARGVPAAPKTLVWFLPYHEISFAISSIEGVALDEAAFGL
jgi:hypothetical protein